MSQITPIPVDTNTDKDTGDHRRIHLREISGDGEGPPETVGQELRAARLRRGDEIAQVSRALKIRKDHLEALEADRLEDLPGKTYAIGFVRSYARYLGLDAAQYVERFKREISGHADEQVREPAPIHLDDRRLSHGWRLIAGAVAILLGWGAWYLLSSNKEASQPVPPVPVLTPPKTAQHPQPQPVTVPPQAATPSPAADAMPPSTNANDASGMASALPPPAAGAKTPATRNTPLSPTSPTAVPGQTPPAVGQTQASAPAVPPGNATYGAANPDARVVLRARNDVLITVKNGDGEVILNRVLRAGDTYQVPNIAGATLAVADAGALEVDLDGRPLGQVGRPAQVLGRVSLDPLSLNDRFNH